MKIGEAARRVGLEPSAIRFYESAAVVPAPGRTASGYRDYQEGDVETLRFVHRLRSLGLPLDDVRGILNLSLSGQAPCMPVREAIAREAAAIDDRIADLLRLRNEFARLQEEAADMTDNWPASCVCHVLDDKEQVNE